MSEIKIYRKSVNTDDMKFYNIAEEVFSISGIFKENGLYRRLPEAVAKTVNAGVNEYHSVTSGGRVRFKTDSSCIAIKVKMGIINLDSNAPVTANAGFDLYERKNNRQYFVKNFMPPFEMTETYEDVINLQGREFKEYVINFPMWSEVAELYIGVDKEARLEKADDYTVKTPVVFYGSSITMGKCFSRPGCSYENILSQRLDFDYINLGFGGSAKGEQEIADYIAGLDMSVFVLDYDWNAPDVEYLKETHERFYKTVRKAHKDIPIIMMSRPKYYLSEEEKLRRQVVEETYKNALERNENVYFIYGNTLMDDKVRDNGTVDGVHPNDAGFMSMANVIEPVLKKALKL